MSKTDNKTQIEETFATKLGIEMVSLRHVEQMIELYAGTKIVVAMVGLSGIGKTATPKKIAAQRNGGKGVPYVQVHAPTATQEGFYIPTTAQDTKEYFDQRIPRTFEPLMKWADMVNKKYKDNVPKDMVAVLVIEELNRAVDKSVTRALFTLIGDRMIGDVKLPDCVQIIVTMNPTGGGMSVNEFEKDPAMRRRLLPVGVAYNHAEFLKYAEKANFHSAVQQFLSASPTAGYDDQSALAGKAFACPATWDEVSTTCYRLEQAGLAFDSVAGRASIAGAVGSAMATMFLEFARDKTVLILPEDVLTSYAKDSEVRTRFLKYMGENEGDQDRKDKVIQLIHGVVQRMFAKLDRDPADYAKQMATFLGDISVEMFRVFMEVMTKQAQENGQDGKNYGYKFNTKMIEFPEFNKVMAAYAEASAAIKRELENKA